LQMLWEMRREWMGSTPINTYVRGERGIPCRRTGSLGSTLFPNIRKHVN
jgi:hypothetical protein